MEFGPRHLYTIPPATGPDSLPGGAVVRRLGPLSPPDHFPACGEMPPGHRQTHHPPERLLPAACRVSASCRAFPSPYRRGRPAPRGDAGTHAPLTPGGAPFPVRVPPLGTHRPPVPGLVGPPPAVVHTPCGSWSRPRRAEDDTARSTARRASGAPGHGGATVAESPPRAMACVGEKRTPRRPPPAARDR